MVGISEVILRSGDINNKIVLGYKLTVLGIACNKAREHITPVKLVEHLLFVSTVVFALCDFLYIL